MKELLENITAIIDGVGSSEVESVNITFTNTSPSPSHRHVLTTQVNLINGFHESIRHDKLYIESHKAPKDILDNIINECRYRYESALIERLNKPSTK